MPIPISCDYCGASYQITDAAAGKRIRCKDCGEPISVPGRTPQRPPSRPAARPAPRLAARPPATRPPATRPARSVGGPRGGDAISQRRERKKKSGGGSNTLLFAGLGICGVVVLGAIGFFVLRATGIFGGDVTDGLTKRGPAPQDYDPVPPSPGVTAITYQSEGRSLKAYMTKPRTQGPHPAVVFFHGGFAFGLGDLESCQPFQDAGFIVLAPTLRGENGNPGDFELFGGEVDDAVAAIKWLANQPDVDKNNIYTFGHSVGGGISALVSLRNDAPIAHGGSTGGMYDQSTFTEWSDIAPFDYRNPKENDRRVLKGRESQMVHDHYGYYGTGDLGIASVATQMNTSGRLKTIPVSGDHFTSVGASMRRYLQVIQRTKRPSAGGQGPATIAANTNPPSETPAARTPADRPPSVSSPAAPSFQPPSFNRPGVNRPSGFPPGFPSNRPGFSGRAGRTTGSRGSGVPSSAESDADLATLRTIMASGDRSKISRGISVLSRSSRKDEAAEILALAVSSDRTRVLVTLPRFGTAGETQILKLLSGGLDQIGESLAISGLTRCGTEKSLPALDRIAGSGGPNAFPAEVAARNIRSKMN